MFTQALVIAAASMAFAAPAPQTTGLCNPVAIPTGPFQLAAYNPQYANTTGLNIATVSRGANILVRTVNGTLTGASEFTYDAAAEKICTVSSFQGCDDGSLNNPLLFGGDMPASEGGITLQAGDGCFSQPGQQPLFATGGATGAGEGTTAETDWNGWVLCSGTVGVYWNGGDAAPVGCEKVGLQVFNL